MQYQLAVRRGLEYGSFILHSVPEFGGICQISVMSDRYVTVSALGDEGLGVAEAVRTRGRISVVANCQMTR
jgi:hypothetical protein